MEDYTEHCIVQDWELCQKNSCKYHGSCHREAMMQPEPIQDPDSRDYESKYAYAAGYPD